MTKIKCRKITYDGDESAGLRLKRTMAVKVSEDMVEVLMTPDGPDIDPYGEMEDYLLDEISEAAGCPATGLEWEIVF